MEPPSPTARMQKVLKTIDEEIRPQLAADGGDIELVDVDGLRVVVSLRGRCAQCRSSEVTIRDLVQRLLREHENHRINGGTRLSGQRRGSAPGR